MYRAFNEMLSGYMGSGTYVSSGIEPNSEPEPKPQKLIGYPKNYNKLFSNVGVEATFYPRITIDPRLDALVPDSWDDAVAAICEETLETIKKNLHPWLTNKYVDEGCLEIPSSHEYTSVNGITKDFIKLLKIMESYGFDTSSKIDRSIEGGCHINFNLQDKLDKYADVNYKLVNLFVDNLVCFLNNNPSIVWAFLAPEDNESSRIITKLQVGHCYDKYPCLRYKDAVKEYIELRFFMMPRDVKEFHYHIRVADAILKYVWNQTIKSPRHRIFHIKNTGDQLKKYTYTKALNELKEVCKILRLSYQEFESFNKHLMLKERFSFGKKYLV